MANCGDNYMDGQRLRCRRPPPHQHLRDARRIDRGQGRHGRIAESYGALIEYLVSQCRRHGVAIHLGAIVKAIDADRRRITVHCDDGAIFEAAAAILPVPLPVLRKSCCLRRRARRRQLVPTSASAMSSKFCCASPQGGGLITAGEPRRPVVSAFQRDHPTWWTSTRPDMRCLTGWFDGAEDRGHRTIGATGDAGVSLDVRRDELHRSAVPTGPSAVLLRRRQVARSSRPRSVAS